MALQRMAPDQYSGELVPCTTATDAAVDFGFQARHIAIYNDRANAVFLNFNSSVPSTGGFRSCAGESLVLTVPLCSVFAVASTTTSTATKVRVLALGG